MKRTQLFALTVVLALVLFTTACQPKEPIILATTTSTADTGLLDVLVPLFQRRMGYEVKTIAVGTGQALALGEKGEADVLLVHSPAAEMKLVENGSAINRQYVMYNDFVIVGPATDPAGVRGMGGGHEALLAIKQSQATFVSRGDDSGTHKKEQELWKTAAITPAGAWYVESGTGMAATLAIAEDKQAYVLTDRGTFLAHKQNLTLVILVEGDPALKNPYHVMQVNPVRFAHVNARGAERFVEFMLSREVQNIISTFGVDKFGQPLFFPAAR
ncbi:MAG: Tungstate-binding protein TupA [Firmicutes bacterium]|nr:Tungstate-binding protein TupA [candidate division NPL-UPA2 bacterium]